MTKASSLARRMSASEAFQPLKGGASRIRCFKIRCWRPLPPGSRLPAERESTKFFNTNRQTIRQAI
jgi:hypothetical protein